MTKKDSFTYNVALADYPITIEVESFDQAIFMAVISDGLVLHPSDSSVVTTFPLSLQAVAGAPAVQRCQIPDPGAAGADPRARYQAPADLNLTFVTSYATANGPTPRYEVRLISQSGSSLVRNIRRPNLRDFLVFEYR